MEHPLPFDPRRTSSRRGAARRVVWWTLTLAAAVAIQLVSAPSAAAAPLKCERTIVAKLAKLVQGRAKLLAKCREQVLIGKRPGPCPDAAFTAKLGKLDAMLTGAIQKACGGDDHACGTPDDDGLAAIGWDLGSCPGFEGGCTAPIVDCGDVAACIGCVGRAAVDQAVALAYDGLTPSAPHGALNRCQATIGRSLVRYLVAKHVALAKCEDKVLSGLVTVRVPTRRRRRRG